MTTDSHTHRVLIAGAGVAGPEALVALSALAPRRLDITMLAPDAEFQIQAVSVEQPFARPAAQRYSVPEICADHGVTYIAEGLASVDAEGRRATTTGGDELSYDSLLVAIGAGRQPILKGRAIVFRGAQDADAMHGLILD